MAKKQPISSLSRHWQPEPGHNGPPVTRYFLQPDAEVPPQGIVISQKNKAIYVKIVSPDGMLTRTTKKADDGSTIFVFKLEKIRKPAEKNVKKPIVKQPVKKKAPKPVAKKTRVKIAAKKGKAPVSATRKKNKTTKKAKK